MYIFVTVLHNIAVICGQLILDLRYEKVPEKNATTTHTVSKGYFLPLILYYLLYLLHYAMQYFYIYIIAFNFKEQLNEYL